MAKKMSDYEKQDRHLARMMAHAYWMALIDNDVDVSTLNHEDWQTFYEKAFVRYSRNMQTFPDISIAYKSYVVMSTVTITIDNDNGSVPTPQLDPCERDND